MTKTILTLLFALIFSYSTTSVSGKTKYTNLPKTLGITSHNNSNPLNNTLFVIERSMNTNKVVYEANFLKYGKLNSEKPVNVYWRLYENNGEREELSYLEKIAAYGIEFEAIVKNKTSYYFHVNALKSRKIRLKLDENNKAFCIMTVSGKQAKLEKIYVKTTDSFFTPGVEYIHIFATDLTTGKPVSEKIYKEQEQ